MVAGNGPLTVALDARLIAGTSTGDSSYWSGLISGLAQRDSSVEFLLISNAPKPVSIPDHPRFHWIEAKGSNRWWSVVTFPLLARKLGAYVCHGQYNMSPLCRNMISTVHDVSFMIEPKWFKPKDRVLLRMGVAKTVSRAKRVITVSNTSLGEINHYFPATIGKTVAIHNAAGLGIHSQSKHEAYARLDSLGIKSPFILTVGTRWPRKNLSLAIDACNALGSEVPHGLVIAGKSGWGPEVLGKRAVTIGFVGDDMLSALYSGADLYLAPSLHEGFGVTVLEAFRCGCPVLASCGGALPEVVNGAGHIMQSWAPDAWTREISRLLRDSSKLDSMRALGFERESEFTWEKSARLHEQVYMEVANGQP